MKEVRCPRCGRLLAMEQDNGEFVCKTSRQVIRTERATLTCTKCGAEVTVGRKPKNDVDKLFLNS